MECVYENSFLSKFKSKQKYALLKRHCNIHMRAPVPTGLDGSFDRDFEKQFLSAIRSVIVVQLGDSRCTMYYLYSILP